MDEKISKLLYRSFDDPLNIDERQLLEKALNASTQLQREKERIETIRQTISRNATHSFKPFFADSVMRKIRALNDKKPEYNSFAEILFQVFRPVAIAATIIFIALISYNLMRSDTISIASAFAEPELTLEEVYDPTITLSLE